MLTNECFGPVNPVKLKKTDILPERVCYDIYAGKEERESTEKKEALLRDALVNQDLLFRWAQIASQIFESDSDSYWNHSGKSWESNFGRNPNYMDLIDCLCHQYNRTSGDDVHKSTGLVLADSLSAVENATGKMAEDLIARKLKGKSFIERATLEPFHDNKDKQTVFYTLAGFRDRYGKTFQFGYTVFGMAFYNFRLKVVSDGTPYNTAIGKYTIEEAIEKGGIPGFTYQNTGSGERVIYPAQNESSMEAVQTVSSSTEISETEANSIANSKEYSFTEAIGLSVELEDILKISKVAIQMQFQATQVINTAYTEEKSVTKTKNSSSSVEVKLPPHTAIAVTQSENNTVTTLEYDCPVLIQFDTAVFSISGTCYDDNAAVHTFSTAGYDQRSFITQFQPSKSGNAGEDASENLYLRYKNYDKIPGYEKVHGATQVKSHNHGMLREELDWSVISGQEAASTSYKRYKEEEEAKTDAPPQLIDMICKNRPMSPAGAMLTESGRSISTTIGNAIALYPLKTIRQQTGSGSYDVGIDDVLYPNNWTVQGYDKGNIPFYGFDRDTGSWILTDKYGVELKDDSLAVIKREPLTNEPFIQGKKEGTVYAKYLIPEGYYTCKDGSEISNKTIQTVFVKIVIHNTELEGRISVSGNVTVKNNTVTNLEKLNTLNVHVYDKAGKEIVVPVVWETEQGCGNGIMILHNRMSVSAAGTYRIRARYESLVSDWVEVIVIE